MWWTFKLGDLMGSVTIPTSTEPSSTRCKILWLKLLNADVHERIAALKFRKNVRKQIEAGRFVGPKYNRALHDVATVRDDLNGFVPQTKQFLRVFKKDFAGRGQLD